MDQSRDEAFDPFRDPELDAAVRTQGRLSNEMAQRLVDRGRAKIDASDPALAIPDFQRVIGHGDPAITGAALLGFGDALYRLDNEGEATEAWESVTRLPDNPSTYRAWRNLAGSRVRAGELPAALEAYREADARAPADDKAAIAARLGWLAKETGQTGAANRYFARSRGSTGFGLTHLVLAVTALVSFIAMDAGSGLVEVLWLDRDSVQQGQLYRLVSVTLVHGGFLHLFLNMYALWIIGPIVESIWGKRLFAGFYVLTALGASTASFLMSDGPAVGASGAIFGLVGVVLAGTRAHHPVLDRRARALVPQLGMFVVINLVFGFLSTAGGLRIDNAAHVGGLLAGMWLGFIVPPGKVPTLRSAVQHPRGETAQRSPILIAAGVVGFLGVVAAGLAFGGATL